MSFKPLPTGPAPPAESTKTPWDPAVLLELVKLLGDSSPQVRGGALAQVASLSASIEGRAALTKTDVVRVLVRLIGDVNQAYVKDAMTALINLAEVSILASQMVDRNVVSRVLDLLIESPDSKMTPLYTMLLSNVTRIPNGAKKLLNLDEDASLKGYYLAKLLPLFLNDPASDKSNPSVAAGNDYSAIGSDKAAWLGSILVNATTLPEGRGIFTDKENRLLKLLVPQISAKNPLRRRAALGVVRNCMFDHKDHEWILNDTEMDLLTELLLPLRNGEPFEDKSDTEGMNIRLVEVMATKKREEDIECLKLIIDTLTLFTATRMGRDYLKAHKVYPVVRALDQAENNETVSQKVYDLVHVLLLDDPEDEESQAAAKADQIKAEAEAAAASQQGSSSIATSSTDSQDESAAQPQKKEEKPAPKAPRDLDEYGEEIEEL